MGSNGLLQPRRPALVLAKAKQRGAEIILDRGPLERHALAGPFLQRFVIGSDSVIEKRRPVFPLVEPHERIAEIHLGRGPLKRHARSFRASR
jgi:hypothetical protein